MKYPILFLPVFLCFHLSAQTGTGNVKTPEVLQQSINHFNASHLGSLMQDFSVTGPDGKVFTNASLKNKVTVLVFWYPSCNCFDFKSLDSIANKFKENKIVQIVAVGPDTADIASYRSLHPVKFPYYTACSYEVLHEINYKNGFPTIFIIDRDGIIKAINTLWQTKNISKIIDDIWGAMM